MSRQDAGLFLSLDGIDGTGKSTQCRLLADWFREQGREVVECVDPGGTPLGQELRQILLVSKGHLSDECEALLFMASRAQLVAEVIRPALEAGRVVISDRYVLANIVYQGYGNGLNLNQLRQVGELSTGGLYPDCTFVLDIPLELGLARRAAAKRIADRMESRPREYHERVREGFLIEARKYPERMAIIDAKGDIGAIQTDLRHEVAKLVGGRR